MPKLAVADLLVAKEVSLLEILVPIGFGSEEAAVVLDSFTVTHSKKAGLVVCVDHELLNRPRRNGLVARSLKVEPGSSMEDVYLPTVDLPEKVGDVAFLNATKGNVSIQGDDPEAIERGHTKKLTAVQATVLNHIFL